MQVLSSISGLPISAVSAGFAPTNSADVSAIASAYQVVSATSTQLYAGTAHLTSVNEAPISASRAGQAANASLATSAYYDGTGRLISALPDSAAVSAIASAYAESAASGKQDAITFGYDANNLISSIDGSALAGGGGGGSVASPSGTIIVTDGTAIESTDSALGPVIVPGEPTGSGTADTTYYNSGSIRTLNYGNFTCYGIGLTFKSSVMDRSVSLSANTGGGTYLSATAMIPSGSTSVKMQLSSSPLTIYDTKILPEGSSIELSGSNPVLFLGNSSETTGVRRLAWRDDVPVVGYSGDYATSIDGKTVSASYSYSSFVSYSAKTASAAMYDSAGRKLSEMAFASSVPSGIVSPSGTLYTSGFSAEATNSAIVTASADGFTSTTSVSPTQLEPSEARTIPIVSANGTTRVVVPFGWASKFTASAVYNGITATATAGGGQPSTATLVTPWATSVDLYASTYVQVNGDVTASAESSTYQSGVGELAWASALPTYTYDTADNITGIDGSSIGGAGGVDSATVSAIASAYVESGVSSKLDSTAASGFYTTGNESGFVDSAYVESQVSGKLDSTASSMFAPSGDYQPSGDYAYNSSLSSKMDATASSMFYTTGNESGFVGSAYVESQVSGKTDSSSMSAYALSADVSATVDLVGTQSANWGGSALQISAGAGISLVKSGNILIISTASV